VYGFSKEDKLSYFLIYIKLYFALIVIPLFSQDSHEEKSIHFFLFFHSFFLYELFKNFSVRESCGSAQENNWYTLKAFYLATSTADLTFQVFFNNLMCNFRIIFLFLSSINCRLCTQPFTSW